MHFIYNHIISVLSWWALSCVWYDGALEKLHLLGYAYYMNGKLEPALNQFIKCVGAFEADWQLLIEISCELDAQRKTAARMLATNKAISDHINKVVAASDKQITSK
jgi:hypothetical protein